MNKQRLFWIILLFVLFLFSCAPTHYEVYPEGYAIASWYGPDFHGKPTSSGEIFNMYDLTCAHRTYPFGTILKVTNISNNRTVRCLVNDRGPFVKGRDIDLSYAAAKEIDLLNDGIGKVKIEYVKRDNGYVKDVMYQSDTGPFTIQVGSFRELSNAVRLKTVLEMKYRKVYITEARIYKELFYRVRIGKFYLKEDAHNTARTLADEGYSVLITKHDEIL